MGNTLLTGNNNQDTLSRPVSTSPSVLDTATTPTNVAALNLAPIPGLATNLPPLQAWLDATNLVFGEDGHLLPSCQSPKINQYIPKAIHLVNLKIFFINTFPKPAIQSNWICQSLIQVLQDQAAKDPVAHQVNLHTQQDNRYLCSLLSMVCFKLSAPSFQQFLT